MESTEKIYSIGEGKIQRVQIVKLEDFNQLHFVFPAYQFSSFAKICALYRDFIVRKYEMFFGKVVLFTLGEEEFSLESFPSKYGELQDPLNAINLLFKDNIFVKDKEICFKNEKVRALFEKLKEEKKLFVAEGKRNGIRFVPVGRKLGYLSQSFFEQDLCVNASFFTMDPLDCGSIFDYVGIPIGLMVEKGKIMNPPQYDREALLVKKDGSVTIEKVSLQQIQVKIDGVLYEDHRNCFYYERPKRKKTPLGKTDLVIVNNKVVCINPKGGTPVPCGGFVIQTEEKISEVKDRKVSYHGLEDILFGLQVGNSAIVNGIKTEKFLSPFYKFYKPWIPSYPPSMYPLNYEKDRAPRILFGADHNNKPMFAWIEGAGKFGHEAGKEGEGASLKEAAEIAEDIGMMNAIHLDGGGSAQILRKGKRSLKLSDRDAVSYAEAERAIPVGIVADQ